MNSSFLNAYSVDIKIVLKKLTKKVSFPGVTNHLDHCLAPFLAKKMILSKRSKVFQNFFFQVSLMKTKRLNEIGAFGAYLN